MLTRPLDGGSSSQAVTTPRGPQTNLADGIPNRGAMANLSMGGPGFIEVLGLQFLAGRTLETGEVCSFLRPIGGARAGPQLRPVPWSSTSGSPKSSFRVRSLSDKFSRRVVSPARLWGWWPMPATRAFGESRSRRCTCRGIPSVTERG